MAAGLRLILTVVIWGLALWGALSIATLPGDWGHAVCGPWGCGPPTQALIGCHLAWLVLLVPAAWWLQFRLDSSLLRRLGQGLVALAVAGVVGIVLHQRLVWWPAVSEWHQSFFWQRCGFVLVTAVQLPVVQTGLVGILWWSRSRRESSEESTATAYEGR